MGCLRPLVEGEIFDGDTRTRMSCDTFIELMNGKISGLKATTTQTSEVLNRCFEGHNPSETDWLSYNTDLKALRGL
jgi:hypothetical protein